jgi:AcrR family transcriptional regulator
MPNQPPKRRRRKTDRPAEIIASALNVFADKGFAAAKLEDIARLAGISKGTLYLYFETKEEMFRAVVATAFAADFEKMEAFANGFEGPIAQLFPIVLSHIAALAANSRLPAIAKMVIAESRNFPDLARIWHDDIVSRVLDTLTKSIARGQKSGELVSGDARLHAFSLVGPMVMALLFREVFAKTAGNPPDLQALALQHSRTVIHGLQGSTTTTGTASGGKKR